MEGSKKVRMYRETEVADTLEPGRYVFAGGDEGPGLAFGVTLPHPTPRAEAWKHVAELRESLLDDGPNAGEEEAKPGATVGVVPVDLLFTIQQTARYLFHLLDIQESVDEVLMRDLAEEVAARSARAWREVDGAVKDGIDHFETEDRAIRFASALAQLNAAAQVAGLDHASLPLDQSSTLPPDEWFWAMCGLAFNLKEWADVYDEAQGLAA